MVKERNYFGLSESLAEVKILLSFFLAKGYFTSFLTGTLSPAVGFGKTRSQLHQI